MRLLLVLSIFAALTTPAVAQVTDAPRWSGALSGISLVLPPGWAPETANTSARADVISGRATAAGMGAASCKITMTASDPVVVDGHTLTQEDYNASDKPLTVDSWLPIFKNAKDITAIEAHPVTMVDGRAAQLVTVTRDEPLRVYTLEADVVSPSAFHQISCFYAIGALARDEPPEFRQHITAEFLALLNSVRWVTTTTP